jgi:hypothetical protein
VIDNQRFKPVLFNTQIEVNHGGEVVRPKGPLTRSDERA